MSPGIISKFVNGLKTMRIKSIFLAYICLARPHQYVKNTFILLPLFFGYKLSDLNAVLKTGYAILVFSLAASAVYILNDIQDIKEDREHPKKRDRPLASGVLTRLNAIVFFLFVLGIALSIGIVMLPIEFIHILIAYLVLNLCYSFYLKHIAIIDVVCIAIGFVFRVMAGGIVAGVSVSHWIVIMTFLLAMFLALGKRRDDLLLFGRGYRGRKSLDGYNLRFVSFSMVMMTSVVVVSYILYCVSPEVIEKHGTSNLYFTSLWVILGVLRYMQITFVDEKSGSPTMILLRERFMWIVILGWLLTFYWLIYVAHN
jgi:decaprenyl-phosphate phosphoribosyltransferase